MENIKTEEKMVDGVHSYTAREKYITPPSPIKEKLEWFKDLKLGFMVHFGLYAQLGIVPSWGMVDDQKHWSRDPDEFGPGANWTDDANKLREEYFGLIRSFNPIRFNADEWADLAEENGFKYLIFTTKHHDGFCLWDTEFSDYKVTSPECPYSTHENADITKKVFDAFRKRDLPIAAYFSKPDFHHPDFWQSEVWHEKGTTWEPTYDIKEQPEKWEAFTEFTHSQLKELVSKYGKIDILWLDGSICTHVFNHEINLDKLVKEVRAINPELIVADRCAETEHENYLTPELTIPDEVIDVPWESCMTIGHGFQYVYDDDYKSASEIIEMLLEIVCKGGNLALNISPQPDGRMPKNAIKVLRQMGAWLKENGEAIYKTRPCAPYKKDNIFFTQTKDCIYAVCQKSDIELIPCPFKISKAQLLSSGEILDFTCEEDGIRLKSPYNTKEEFTVIKLYK